MNRVNQIKRSVYQMTLGEIIDYLEEQPKDRLVKGLGYLCSYRGYYCDLAFAPTNNETVTVESLLGKCKDVMGRTFTGYKGGDYMMGENTPLWVAPYGSCGERLMFLSSDNSGVLFANTSPEEDYDIDMS